MRGATLIYIGTFALGPVLVGCSLLHSNASKVPDSAIKIGLLLPFSGTSAQLGSSVAAGARLAIEQINAAGGVRGQKLALVNADSQSSPTVSPTRAAELIDQGVVAIIGDVNSSATKAVIDQQGKQRGCPIISPGSTSTELGDPTKFDTGGWFFRTVASDNLQGKAIAKLADDAGYKKLGIVYVDNTYGQGFANVVKTAFSALPGHQVFTATYSEEPLPKPSYTDILDPLLANSPEGIVMIGYPGGAARIFKDWVLGGKDGQAKWMFGQALRGDSFTNNVADPQHLEGMQGTFPRLAGANYDRFLAEYTAKYNAAPETLYATTAYDAAALVAFAIQRGGATRDGVKASMRAVSAGSGQVVNAGADGIKAGLAALQAGKEINYEGASGTVDLDEHGDVLTGSYVVWQVKGGKIEDTSKVIVP